VWNKTGLLLLFLVLCFGGWQSVKAIQQMGIEHNYAELGYTSVSQAIEEAENFYGTSIGLPKKLLPLEITHSFGRFDQENETVEIEFLNEKLHFNYIINIMPANKRSTMFSFTDFEVPLEDGTQAYYSVSGMDDQKIILFNFQKSNWIYMISVEVGLLDNPIETMVEVANSF
jgi:hypothetical protein